SSEEPPLSNFNSYWDISRFDREHHYPILLEHELSVRTNEWKKACDKLVVRNFLFQLRHNLRADRLWRLRESQPTFDIYLHFDRVRMNHVEALLCHDRLQFTKCQRTCMTRVTQALVMVISIGQPWFYWRQEVNNGNVPARSDGTCHLTNRNGWRDKVV